MHWTDQFSKPDYAGGGIVNLMSSIATGLGASGSHYPAADLVPAERLADSENIVLLVIDGLGIDRLLAFPAGPLRSHLLGVLTSVFPTTTASAIPVFLTGLAPQQHGLTGWYTYFREIGCTVAALPFKPRFAKITLPELGVQPSALLSGRALTECLAARCYSVAPERIAHSAFNRHYAGSASIRPYSDTQDLFEQIAAVLGNGRGRRYVYAYYGDFDTAAHEFGVHSPQADAALSAIDQAFGRFLDAARPSNTVVLVTADHGFLDLTGKWLELPDRRELAETLAQPLGGEPRAPFCYVAKGCEQRFLEAVDSVFAGRAIAVPSVELLEAGYFGEGRPHPELVHRIGDYVLLMRDPVALKDWLPGEHRYTHVGVHGGLDDAELRVPLILADLN